MRHHATAIAFCARADRRSGPTPPIPRAAPANCGNRGALRRLCQHDRQSAPALRHTDTAKARRKGERERGRGGEEVTGCISIQRCHHVIYISYAVEGFGAASPPQTPLRSVSFKLALENLAGGGLRERIANLDRARVFVGGQSFLAVVDNILGSCALAGLERHYRLDLFA